MVIGRDLSLWLIRRWLPVSAGIFVVLTALRFAAGTVGDGLGFLYIVAICIAALGGGLRGGVVASLVASGLTFGWAEVKGADLPLFGYGVRLVGYLVVVALVSSLETERERLLDRLHGLAHSDDLTGLPNRRAWEQQIESALARADRSGVPVSIGVIDLDHFKAYNDAHGHAGGDRLLRAAAGSWHAQTRSADFLARFGGEEFAFILWGSDTEGAATMANRIRAATPAGATCSVGCATWDGSETADALVQRADAALYMAKAAGRNRVISAPAPLASA